MSSMKKKTILIAGCGDIALRTAPLLRNRYRILGLYRDPESVNRLRAHGIIPIYGNLDSPKTLKRIAGIAHLVLHLAPPPNQGVRDPRTKHLLSAISRHSRLQTKILPQRLVYISTTGVYGNCFGRLINETNVVHPENDRAVRRVDAEKQLRNWGRRNFVAVSILRVPGIYASDRLPLNRLREGHPAILDLEDSFTNHIHADDLARIIQYTLRFGKPNRIYHACDDSHFKMGAYFDLVADHFNLPRPPRITRAEAQKQMTPGMLSFINESRRITNFRMKNELRVKLQYPTVQEGIQAAKINNR